MRALAPVLALLAGPALADLAGFRTPSGNIHCLGSDEAGAAFVDCEILERDGPPVLRPAGCEGEWGSRFSVSEAGSGVMVCAGDTVRDARNLVLPYGGTASFGAITCLSTEAGLQCLNPEGHGISLARATQSAF